MQSTAKFSLYVPSHSLLSVLIPSKYLPPPTPPQYSTKAQHPRSPRGIHTQTRW
ncbi:hypothetical protein BDQ17DRAFT_1348377 [Cyathus striatus]|nr:hypothetical protein BDQ17DRAFT_1348377 [Cyathus striatus]